MFVARWEIDARFGHKQSAVDLMRRWERDIGRQAGTEKMDLKFLTGSIGAAESRIEVNHSIESLAQLENFYAAIGKIEAHRQWAKDLEPFVVSGSPRWTIYRVL